MRKDLVKDLREQGIVRERQGQVKYFQLGLEKCILILLLASTNYLDHSIKSRLDNYNKV